MTTRLIRYINAFWLCSVILLAGRGISWGVDSFSYSWIETSYHTDYTPDGERIRIIDTDETYMPADALTSNKSGEMLYGSYTVEAYAASAPGYNRASARVDVTDARQEQVMAYAISQWWDDGIASTLSSDTQGILCLDIMLQGQAKGEGNSFFFEVTCSGDCWEESGNLRADTRGDLSDVPVSVSGCFGYEVGGIVNLFAELAVQTYVGHFDGSGEWDGVTFTEEDYVDYSHSAIVTGYTLTKGHSIEWSSGTEYPVASAGSGSGGGGGGGGGCFISSIKE